MTDLEPMTPEALRQQLKEAGVELTEGAMKLSPPANLRVDDNSRVLPFDGVLRLAFGDPRQLLEFQLPPLRDLFRGDATPGDFGTVPAPEYRGLLYSLEMTAATYCSLAPAPVTDQEFHRLFRRLGRNPDGTDHHLLFAYLQASAQIYLAVHETSQAEYEAVVGRLERSAKSYSAKPISRNYWEQVLSTMG